MYPQSTKLREMRSHDISFVAKDFSENFNVLDRSFRKNTCDMTSAAESIATKFSNKNLSERASSKSVNSHASLLSPSVNPQRIYHRHIATPSRTSSTPSPCQISSLSPISSSLDSQTSCPTSFFASSFASDKKSAHVRPSVSSVLFRTARFEVRPSTKRGLGAFAISDIPKDAIIHSEAPLFQSNAMGLYAAYEELSPEQKSQYHSLAVWWGTSCSEVMAIFMTNRYQTSRDLKGIFLQSSRFNHTCAPFATCTYSWQEESEVLVFTALRRIKEGEEITVSYSSDPETLYQNYGFNCDCSCCESAKAISREKQ